MLCSHWYTSWPSCSKMYLPSDVFLVFADVDTAPGPELGGFVSIKQVLPTKSTHKHENHEERFPGVARISRVILQISARLSEGYKYCYTKVYHSRANEA